LSGSNSLELSESHTQVELLVGELKTAFEQVVVHDDDGYVIPPPFVCMAIWDDRRDIGPIAKSAIPQLLTILQMDATNEDQRLLQLRAAHAHFEITGEPDICLDVAVKLLDVISKNRFSDNLTSDFDESFWLRAWSCDILSEMRVTALTAVERLKRLSDEDGCTFVRESARNAIEKIGE
jgi:hypothetical protein